MSEKRNEAGLTKEEQKQYIKLQNKVQKEKWEKDKIEENKRYVGYLFWCSEGCGFVDRDHRCEQWTSLTYISPKLVEAFRKKFQSVREGEKQ